MRAVTLNTRSAGLLLHVTSLPGPYYTGDLGAEARRFIDFLAAANQSWWQMLPVNPIGDGDSPYATISSFAGEPLLIDLAALAKAGWLAKKQVVTPANGSSERADYRRSRAFRLPLLKEAFAKAWPKLSESGEMQLFRQREQAWLGDYTLFGALSAHFSTTDWTTWPEELRDRKGEAMIRAKADLAADIALREFWQFIFDQQWRQLKDYAQRKGIGLIGDLPIFVAAQSADVWANRRFFLLDKSGRPTVVAGVPPDAFNKDGQRWGNALYDWQALQKEGFAWWISRLARVAELFDAVRLDHFIGFARYWEIQAKDKTARRGRWVPVPGHDFFREVTRKVPAAQFIAEDLGPVTPEVRDLRDQFGFPGMKVLQFAFDGSEEANHHLPHRLPEESAAYTGTHDNDTTLGWYSALAKRAKAGAKAAKIELRNVHAYLGADGKKMPGNLARAAYGSAANLVVLPVQDVLGLATKARMNVPGVATGNWRYRLKAGQLNKEVAMDLDAMVRVFDRATR